MVLMKDDSLQCLVGELSSKAMYLSSCLLFQITSLIRRLWVQQGKLYTLSLLRSLAILYAIAECINARGCLPEIRDHVPSYPILLRLASTMTSPPVTRDDIDTLTFLNILVAGLFPLPVSGAVQLGRRNFGLGSGGYRAMVTGNPVVASPNGLLTTVLIPVQVANSRSEVLLKLLEAVEDYAPQRFP